MDIIQCERGEGLAVDGAVGGQDGQWAELKAQISASNMLQIYRSLAFGAVSSFTPREC